MITAAFYRRHGFHVVLILCACLLELTTAIAGAAPAPVIGVISTLAGTGVGGYNGDLAAATLSQVSNPNGVAVDAAGNVYIADTSNQRIRKVTVGTGIISTVAGTGTGGFTGDGGVATSARLSGPTGIAVDAAGNLYIADQNNQRIRKVTAATGIITTVAGSGAATYGGDNGAATAAQLNYPFGVTVDAAGNLFIADYNNHRVRKVTAATGIITTVAGNGVAGYTGDGLATGVSLYNPTGVAVDSAGYIYIADYNNSRIRKVVPSSGLISTVAGTGIAGYDNEAGLATTARLNRPTGITVDVAGNVYFTEYYNLRVRKLTVASGVLTTVAGNDTAAFGGDGGEATAAELNGPCGVTIDGAGNMYIADTLHDRVRKVGPPVPTRQITTIIGTGTAGYNGDGLATGARVYSPAGVAVDAAGNVFIADQNNHRIRRVTAATGIVSTVAGTGVAGYSGEAGPALNARMNNPIGIALDTAGNVYFADYYNHRVRMVTAATGIITTVAGNGTGGYLGDGGLATAAELYFPTGVAVDAAGNVFIADYSNHRIRRVAAGTKVITTVAGNGTSGVGGDGGQATLAQLNNPAGVAVDGAGNIYIADQDNYRIRKVTAATGLMSTYAGNGSGGYAGDSVPAISAQLYHPTGVAADPAGNVYIADEFDQRIRKVDVATQLITTVAGSGSADFGGDTGAATAGQLNYPYGVAVDAVGSLYIADMNNHRVRKAAIPIGEPTNLTAVLVPPASIRLAWNAGAGAASYTIRRGTVAGGSKTVIATGVTAPTYTDSTVAPGITYYYVVTSIGGGSESAYSNEASIKSSKSGLTDLDGDGRGDIMVFRPSSGQWFVRYSSQGYDAGGAGVYGWGLPGDLPIAGDVDGDGTTDLTVYRPSTAQWLIRYSSQGFSAATAGTYQWGLPGDVPIAADFDGDRRLDLTVYRPSTGEWFIRYSSRNYDVSAYGAYQWGLPGDVPLAGDFDGDGKTDLTVYRPSTGQWFVRLSSQGYNPAAMAVYQWGLTADVPLVADFDGDGQADITVYRPSTNDWIIRYSSQGYNPATSASYHWGALGDIPVVVDLDGDGRTELTVFRPSTGEWFILYSAQNYSGGSAGTYQWGLPSDTPIPKAYDATVHAGDFEGDGKADLAVYRPSTGSWYVAQSQGGYNPATPLAVQWGLPGDVPVSRDFDGDRLLDIGVFRPSTGQWFIRYSSQGYSADTYSLYQWGLPGDVPLGADLDGDGRADIIAYRPSTSQWFIRYSGQGYSTATYGLYQWGLNGDMPFAADFDGDGKADLAVYRPSTGQWFILYSRAGYSSTAPGIYQVGIPGDTPVAGDFDGDGRADLAIYRPSTGHWLIRYSSQGYSAAAAGDYQWGEATDLPLVRDFDGDGRAEITVYRPGTGQWLVRYSRLNYFGTVGIFQWGLPGDTPVPQP